MTDIDPRVLTAPADTLLERVEELGVLRAASAAAADGSGTIVVVIGPAGIGKSRLFAEGRSIMTANGFTVLGARGGELEQDYPFGVVRQLFEPPIRRDHGEWLTGPAAGAAPVFSLPGDTGDGDPSFAVLQALYWLTVNASAPAPLLLVVDDLHWCDLPSLRFLAHLAPRLDGLPVLLAVGVRSDEPGPAVSRRLIATICAGSSVVAVRPTPLSQGAITRLAENYLGKTPDPSFASACHRATGGNPLLVTELLRALHTTRVPPDEAHIDAVVVTGARAVAHTVLLRLAQLSRDAIEVARATAVLGGDAEPHTVELLTGADTAAVATAVDALVRAEILRPDLPLEFVHSLVREAVYQDLAPSEQRLRHTRAAQVLRDAGGPAARVATQLLAVAPQQQPWAAGLLRDAARTALQSGAVDSAVTYLRRAERELLSQSEHTELMRELGTAEALVDAPAAVEHLTAAYAALGEPVARTAVADLLARLLLFTRPAREAAAVARSGGLQAPADRIDERCALQALELYAVHFGAPDADTTGRLTRALADADGAGPGARGLLAVAAWDKALTGATAAECLDLVQAALAGGVLVRADPALMSSIAASVLILAEADETVTVLDGMLAAGHQAGSLFAIAGIHHCQGWNWLQRGELAEAEACIRQALADDAALHESTWNAGTPYAATVLAEVLIERGDLSGARDALASGGTPAPGSDADALHRRARIEVLLAEGRHERAAEAAEAFAAHAGRIVNPGWAPWRSLKARALIHQDRRSEAVRLLDEELALARGWGAPGLIGSTLRRAGAARDAVAGVPLLKEAVRVTDRSSATLEHAKSLTALGHALHRAGYDADARVPLRAAVELATRCGATPLAVRATDELRAAGGRPHPGRRTTGAAALTPSERRVAELAAAGHSNRRIAQALFVTPKTIEVHLSSAYRKLGIHARADLPHALASTT